MTSSREAGMSGRGREAQKPKELGWLLTRAAAYSLHWRVRVLAEGRSPCVR